MRYSILCDDNTVKPVTRDVWMTWMEKSPRRFVARTELSTDVHISTVFIGMLHVLFETCVFLPDVVPGILIDGEPCRESLVTDRYTTWDEAVAGHSARVKLYTGWLQGTHVYVKAHIGASE